MNQKKCPAKWQNVWKVESVQHSAGKVNAKQKGKKAKSAESAKTEKSPSHVFQKNSLRRVIIAFSCKDPLGPSVLNFRKARKAHTYSRVRGNRILCKTFEFLCFVILPFFIWTYSQLDVFSFGRFPIWRFPILALPHFRAPFFLILQLSTFIT